MTFVDPRVAPRSAHQAECHECAREGVGAFSYQPRLDAACYDAAQMKTAVGGAEADAPLPRPGPLAPGLALIFDMDGVIVDSMPVHIAVWREYLHSLGLDAAGIEDRIHGLKNEEIVLHFMGASADGQGVPEYADYQQDHGAAKERLYRETMGGRLADHLVPGIAAFLERMREMPMALASNAERANIDFVLDGAALRTFFRVIVDASEVARAKPAPDLFLLAAGKLGVAPRNCIVFEDSPAGVIAARAAGMRVVGILTHAAALKDVDFSARHFQDRELDAWLTSQHAA